jgi:hypothetical protein
LVVIDPVSAYFGTSLDSYRDTDVRSVLAPLVLIAERRQIAVLGIMHIGKGSDRSARHRVLGSVAFVNAARLVFAVGMDPNDNECRLFVPVKSNLCHPAPTLAFRLEDAGQTARVVWDSREVTGISAEEVLNGTASPDREQERDGKTFLHDLLEGADRGRMASPDVMKAAKRAGLSERTMWRAKAQLRVESKLIGFGKWQKSFWVLPPPSGTDVRVAERAIPGDFAKKSSESATSDSDPDMSVADRLTTPDSVSDKVPGVLTHPDSVSPHVRVAKSENSLAKLPDHSKTAKADTADLKDGDFERF